MCNLYSHLKPVEAVTRLFGITSVHSSAGNLPAQPAIFPGYDAPVARVRDGGRELVMMHWGFVLPQQGRAPKLVNNTRDDKAASSGFWRESFESRRCLVPATSFAEYHPGHRDAKGHKTAVWFGLRGDEPRPEFAFAGIWRAWRGPLRGEVRDLVVYSILTTRPNELVRPIHPSRMPVILDPADHEAWLNGSPRDAAALLQPLPAERMRIAFEGGKEDAGEAEAQPGLL